MQQSELRHSGELWRTFQDENTVWTPGGAGEDSEDDLKRDDLYAIRLNKMIH